MDDARLAQLRAFLAGTRAHWDEPPRLLLSTDYVALLVGDVVDLLDEIVALRKVAEAARNEDAPMRELVAALAALDESR